MSNLSNNNITPPTNIITMVFHLPTPYGVDSMIRLNPMHGRPSEGVVQALLRGVLVLYKSIK